LRSADRVACEDTRRTGLLLSQLGISRPLTSLHEHNEAVRINGLLAEIAAGRIVTLVSDAGTPAISDPGYLLIRAVIDAGLDLTVLPGPSAVIVAVVASGLPLDSWTFTGFLPRKQSALADALANPGALVAFESPRRLARTLEVLSEMDPARPVAVCRELTKTHEQVVRGSAAEVSSHFRGTKPLGEVVLVVGAGSVNSPIGPCVDAVARLVSSGAQAREAAAVVAEMKGVSKNRIYNEWLKRT